MHPYSEHEKLVNLDFIQKYGETQQFVETVSESTGIFSYLNFLSHPHFYDTLVGSSYGIFTWTPILFFAIIGLFVYIYKKKTQNILIFLGLFLLIYVTSCLKKGGMSFGDRYLITATFIFIMLYFFVLRHIFCSISHLKC